MTDEEIIHVVSAHKEGKKIEFRYCCADGDGWSPWMEVLSTHTGFDFRRNEYRIAPELRIPRECDLYFRNGFPEVRNFSGDPPMNGTTIHVREVDDAATSGEPTVASTTASGKPKE